MIDLVQIQDYMRQHLAKDMEQRNVTVSGENLPDALKQASIELALPLKKIDYEVLDPGSKGLFGRNKTPCRILAYPSPGLEEGAGSSGKGETALASDVKVDISVDGRVDVRRDPTGIMMKISPPEKDGLRITEQDALDALNQKNILNADMSVVSKLVKKADNMFVKIADFDHDPAQDAVMSVDIQDMEMTAYITINPPGEKGADLEFASIMGFLQAKGVVDGYLDDAIKNLFANPIYDRPILVAKGRKAKNGVDAKISYEFETDTDTIRLDEIDGKINYKELGKINNVVAGQVLAKLTEYTAGEEGQTVTGRTLTAYSGNSTKLEVGNNVRLSDDGLTAIADADGQVFLINDKVTVEPVFILNNGVNLKTGNVLFLGTVMVAGNVEDGFSVKAAGNIEITGSVGKCELDAEGDVIIRQGMNGRDSGSITAGGNVYARFIQNTKVIASGMVVVSDGIINSDVSSDSKILCKGKRASIVGGSLKASEEINAKTLGSVAHVETHLEVGSDPKSKEQLLHLITEEKDLVERHAKLSKDLSMLDRLLRTKKKLPPDRMKRYKAFKQEAEECKLRLTEIAEEKDDVNTHLNDLKVGGKIAASTVVFPGVRISIKNAVLEVRSEFKQVTFVNKEDMVRVTKYEEIHDDISMLKTTKRSY